MNLGKRITVFSPKACYMLFELNETFNLSDKQKETKEKEESETGSDVLVPGELDTIMYNGPVKVFTTLRELNEQLAKENATSDTADDVEKKLYKGHLFSAREFPLEAENKDSMTFVIEKVDNNTCFVEQVLSLGDAAQSIEEEVNMLLQHGTVKGLEASEITDYMIFHGKHMPLSFYCYDSDI
jgi:hypothetical protein